MTRLGISNIAWTPAEDGPALGLLEELGISGLEIAPGLAFAAEDDPLRPSSAAIAAFLSTLERHRLEPIAMQSLLFGIAGAALFESEDANARLVAVIGRAIDLAHAIGIPTLVFGSPGARRIPPGMTPSEADRILVQTFRRLGDVAGGAGVSLALEPNHPRYGGDVLTTMRATIDAVRAIAHPAVSVNFDLGALAMEGVYHEAGAWFGEARTLVGHVHVSEPDLAAAPADDAAFAHAARDIAGQDYRGWWSVEMRAGGGDNVERVRSSLTRALRALETAAVAA